MVDCIHNRIELPVIFIMRIDENILDLIPQKTPFVMVANLLYADDKITQTNFTIKEENIFLEKGKFSEAGLIENMAQTAAAGAGYNSKRNNKPVQIGYIGSVKNLEIFSLPKINDEIITEITIENQLFNVTIISGKIWCDETLVAQCEMKIFLDEKK